jgi:hypothetical protein
MDARLAAGEQLLERQRHLLETERKVSDGLSRLREQYKEEIRSIVGAEAWDSHQEQYRELLSRFAETRDRFARTPAGEKKEKKHEEGLKKEKHEFYHGLGFDTRKAIVTRAKYVKKARQILDASLEADAEIPDDAELEEPEPTSNPWTWVFPPYNHQWTYTAASTGSRGSRSRSLSASGVSGEISLWNRMALYGADDSDWSKTDIMAEVGFWFRMPAAGLVEVWIRYRDIDTDYTGRLWDESGCSDANVRQLSRAYLWTSGSSERYSTVIDYRRGESSGSWARGGPTAPGAILSRHLFSHRSYATNEWVDVRAGVRDMNYFWVDDMGCRSTMTSKWHVDHVAIRSTGAP